MILGTVHSFDTITSFRYIVLKEPTYDPKGTVGKWTKHMTKKEILAKARFAKSAEELVLLAKKNGIELKIEEANKAFEASHARKKLSADQLCAVAGGSDTDDKGDNEDKSRDRVGKSLYLFN